MYKRVIILIFLFAYGMNGFSQSTITEIDKETYQLYMQKDWKQLIKVGKGAKKQGFDFFYLNYRIGIAYYTLKNYRASIPFFEAAYEQNTKDDKLVEYLYYAYLFGGKENDAKLFVSRVADEQKEGLTGHEIKFLDKVNLYYGSGKIANDGVLSSSKVESNISETDNGSQQITERQAVVSLGLKHQLLPQLSLHHEYTGLSKHNFYYTRDLDGVFVDEDRLTRQNQYYVNINMHPIYNIDINGGIHYLSITYPSEYTGRGGNGRPVRVAEDTTENEIIYFGGLSYSYRNIDLALSASFANLGTGKQSQQDLSITYYPLGNLSFYSVSKVSFLHEKEDGDAGDELIFYQKLGLGVKEKVWVEPFLMTGNIRNYTAANASIVYNGVDEMKRLYGCNLLLPIYNSKILLSLSYSHAEYESSFYEFTKGEFSNKINYNQNSITGGISWKL